MRRKGVQDVQKKKAKKCYVSQDLYETERMGRSMSERQISTGICYSSADTINNAGCY